jgi:hypothetical protein
MATEYSFTGTKSGNTANNDNVISYNNDSGLLISTGEIGGYKYIPASELKIDSTSTDGAYSAGKIPSLETGLTSASNFKEAESSNVTQVAGATYVFGIDKIKASYITPEKTSGFLSKEIDIGKCSYIKLAATTAGQYDSMEYYIVDGTTEAPILPIGIQKIEGERLFYGLPTCFTVDTKFPVTIKENGLDTGIKYSDINSIIFDSDSTYTISYTPTSDAYEYFPSNEKIKVKAIQRCYKTVAPAAITSIVIQKYGGGIPWAMSE